MTEDSWKNLRRLTTARIALGRAGGSLPTGALLDFRAAHAVARDAVHAEFDVDGIARALKAAGLDSLIVESEAADRDTYLKRPDLGRTLSVMSRERLQEAVKTGVDVALVLSNGLSSLAVSENGVAFLTELSKRLKESGLSASPVVLVRNGRVAIQDPIGELARAKVAVIAVGERPGLASADSLGVYLVYGPKTGNTDANRNCLSNIRAGGMSPEVAGARCHALIREAISRKLSGVELKENSRSLSENPKLTPRVNL